MSAKHGEFRELITSMFRDRHKQPHLTVSLLRQHWGDILGQQLARKTYPARMAGHTLWINALDASWAYQLQFMKHELLESVQVFMGSEDITELRFRQGELHATVDGDEAVAPEGSEENPEESSGNRTAHKAGAGAESGKHAAADSTASGEAPQVDQVAESVMESAAADVIADDSLRDSFRRWAQVKKTKKPGRL
jgi:hypothetical protein